MTSIRRELPRYASREEEIAVRDRPESEQKNPIELSDEEVGEIVTRSREIGRKAVGSSSQVEPADHVMPTVQASLGH
jgi:hypothetical protein